MTFFSVLHRNLADKRRRSAWRQATCQSTGACCLRSHRQTCRFTWIDVSCLLHGPQRNSQRDLSAYPESETPQLSITLQHMHLQA